MKNNIIYFILIFISCEKSNNISDPIDTGNMVTTQGLDFIPDLIYCELGDTVFFTLTPSHNMVQVSQTTYQNNGGTPLDGGFNIDYGQSGYFVPESIGTYYYVMSTTSSWNEEQRNYCSVNKKYLVKINLLTIQESD